MDYYNNCGIGNFIFSMDWNEERQNPETQIRPLREKCKREDWEYEIFQEFASGIKESRPELDRMLQRIRKDEFNIVLVWRLDRLGRSLKHLLQLGVLFNSSSTSGLISYFDLIFWNRIIALMCLQYKPFPLHLFLKSGQLQE